MKVLFDLQDYLRDKPLGELVDDKLFSPYGDTPPTLLLEQVEDVKVVRITNRAGHDSGIEIMLSSIDNIGSDGRIIVVGRFGQLLNLHGARIAMFSKEDKDVEISFYEPYSNLYSLTGLLADVVGRRLYISLTKTNTFSLGLDFYVDGILIVRKE